MQRLLTGREKIILYSAVFTLISSLVFNLFIIPIVKKKEELDTEIGLAKNKLKRYLVLRRQKDFINNKYKEFTSDPTLPGKDADSLINTLAKIENLAQNAKIHIIDIRPQSTRSQESYKEMLIDLRSEGTIESFIEFIYHLENSLLLLKVKKLKLNSVPNSNILEGTFTISKLTVSD